MKKVALFIILLAAFIYAAYEALIYVDNNFPYGRMWETPAVRPHEEKPIPGATGTVPFHGGEAIYRAAPGESLKSPLPAGDPEAVSLGEKLYFNYCAQCHGKNHDGNGTVGQSFAPPPTDLRSPKVQNMAEGVHFQHIGYGVPGGRQPPLATTVSPLDRWRIIRYIQSLGIRDPAPRS